MVNLLTLSPVVLFLTSVAASSSLSVPLKTSKRSTRTPQGIAAELQQGRQVLVTKYGGTIESRKREVGVEVLGNIAADTSFVGTIDVGGSSFSVIVDTGSAVSLPPDQTYGVFKADHLPDSYRILCWPLPLVKRAKATLCSTLLLRQA